MHALDSHEELVEGANDDGAIFGPGCKGSLFGVTGVEQRLEMRVQIRLDRHAHRQRLDAECVPLVDKVLNLAPQLLRFGLETLNRRGGLINVELKRNETRRRLPMQNRFLLLQIHK